jgi:hypothetical protein
MIIYQVCHNILQCFEKDLSNEALHAEIDKLMLERK